MDNEASGTAIPADKPKPSRDQIRSAFLSRKVKISIITLENGMEVEVRQPSVGEQIALANLDDNTQRAMRMLIDHVYVPDTEEKLFDPADAEVIMQTPAGGDYSKLMTFVMGYLDMPAMVKAASKKSDSTSVSG